MTAAVRNPQRFTQCYVTLPEMRTLLRRIGLIVAAPVFRDASGSSEALWYPFYSGFAFLQLPTRAPGRADQFDSTLPMRWQATAAARLQLRRVHRALPILKVFHEVESGTLLTGWEKKARLPFDLQRTGILFFIAVGSYTAVASCDRDAGR